MNIYSACLSTKREVLPGSECGKFRSPLRNNWVQFQGNWQLLHHCFLTCLSLTDITCSFLRRQKKEEKNQACYVGILCILFYWEPLYYKVWQCLWLQKNAVGISQRRSHPPAPSLSKALQTTPSSLFSILLLLFPTSSCLWRRSSGVLQSKKLEKLRKTVLNGAKIKPYSPRPDLTLCLLHHSGSCRSPPILSWYSHTGGGTTPRLLHYFARCPNLTVFLVLRTTVKNNKGAY